MRFYILSGGRKLILPKLRGHDSEGFLQMRCRGGAQQEKRRYGKAKNHQKLRRSDIPTFKSVVGMGDGKSESRHTENPWERTESTEKNAEKVQRNAEKTQRSTRKTHGNAQEVQKAQKTQKKYRKRRNHTAREMKRGETDKATRMPCTMRHCFEYEGRSRTLFRFCSDDGDIIP